MNALHTAINQACQTLHLDSEELQLWLDQHLGLTLYPQVQLLRMVSKYELDPLSDEICLLQNSEGDYQPFITIDGWSKIINNHPQYAGMSLRESIELIDNIPTWLECTIYRNDRILPIIVKEYLEEVRTDHPSWQQMPRRMLRHRVIQQCARLAFNISSTDRVPRTVHKETALVKDTPKLFRKDHVSILKDKLQK